MLLSIMHLQGSANQFSTEVKAWLYIWKSVLKILLQNPQILIAYIKHTPLKSSKNIFLVSSVQCNPVAETFSTPRTALLSALKTHSHIVANRKLAMSETA